MSSQFKVRKLFIREGDEWDYLMYRKYLCCSDTIGKVEKEVTSDLRILLNNISRGCRDKTCMVYIEDPLCINHISQIGITPTAYYC